MPGTEPSPEENKRFLKGWATPARRHLSLSALAGLGATLGTILQAYAFAATVHLVVIEGAAVGRISGWFLVFAAVTILKALSACLSEAWAAEGALRVQHSIRQRVLDRLFSEDRAAFSMFPMRAAQTATALIEQTDKLEGYYARYYPRMVLMVLSPLLILAFVFPVSWVAGVMLLLAAPVIPINMAVVGLGAEAASRRQFEALRRLSGYFLDRLQGLQTLKRLGYAERETENVAAASDELRTRTMAVLRVAFLSSAILEFFATFAIAIVATYIGLVLLGYVGFGVGAEGMTLGEGFFVLLLAPAYFRPLRKLAAAYHDRADALAAAEDLAPLTEPPPKTPRHDVPEHRPLRRVETVELRGTSVRFEGREPPALDRVDLIASSGDKVAVTGPSGSGKSTLLGLVSGQLPPTEGEVLVNGRDLRDFSPESSRALTGWIGQRPYLFPDTIAANIALGQPERSREDIEQAAYRARVTDFARRLPEGLDAPIGERGVGLSGGEAQRVALARAFLKDAPLLLFDEPTAHLDPATEAELIGTIAALSEGRTVLIATHSPAVTGLCDRAVRLEGGAIREEPQRA